MGTSRISSPDSEPGMVQARQATALLKITPELPAEQLTADL